MNKKFINNFLKGSLSTSIGQFSTIAFHFFSIMLMTRYVSKEVFGIYFLILAVSFLFLKLSSLGLELTLVKFTASRGNSEEIAGVFIPILFLRTIQLVLVSLVFLSLSDFVLRLFNEEIIEFTFSIIIIYSLGSYRELFFNLLQGLKKYKEYAFAQVLSAITKFLLILFIIVTSNLTLQDLIYVEIISYSFTILVQVFLTPTFEFRYFEFNRRILSKILHFSLPLYLNNILTAINDRVNIFIIAAYLNPASIANFEVAKKIPEAFTRMFQSFIIVYFPNLATLFSEQKNDDAYKLINKSVSFFSISILSLVSVALLFQQEIIVLVFSERYSVTSFAFVLLMFNFYLRTIQNIFGYSLVAAGYSSVPAKVNSISIIINISAGLAIIPIVGFIGAVYALLLGNTFSLLLNYLFLIKYKIGVQIINFLKPVTFFILLFLLYYLLGTQNIGFRIFLLVSYMSLSLVFAKDFRQLIQTAITSFRKAG